jgi:MFS family permease
MRALRVPAFRWYTLGRLAGSSTGPLRAIVQGWLVYQLTGSLLALGGVSSLRSGAMVLVAPVAGVLSDRIDKRIVMIVARVALTLTNIALALLTMTGALQLWHLLAGAVLEGIALAAKDPAERSLLAEIVSHGTLASAISTTSVFEGLMGMVAATVGGVMLDAVGAGSLFIALAVLFALCAFTYVHLPKTAGAGASTAAVHLDVLSVVRYLRADPTLPMLLALSFTRVLLLPYQTFLPALTEDRFGMGAAGLGWLKSAAGAGQLLSSLWVASLGYISEARERRTVIVAGVAAGIVLVLFVQMPILPLPFVLIFIESGIANVARVMNRSSLQVNCKAAYRGRVTSVSVMLMHLAHLGTVPTGALADRVGAVGVLTVLGLAAVVAHLAIGSRWESVAQQP